MVVAVILLAGSLGVAAPFHVTYLWHMHQPIYYPYISINDTYQFNFSVPGVFDGDRTAAYTVWPKDAVQQGADKGMSHAGAQVSYSGSLGENANNLWGYNANTESYRWARNGLQTSLGNPRLDLVGIAYHHSLMPLTCRESMIMQIKLHKEQYMERWNTSEYSKGFWPPECAFDASIIPALVEEGLEWVIVDNGHLFRTVPDFPWNSASSCRPNPAEVQNPSSTELGSEWVQINNLWAPTKVLAPWSYQPHYVQYIDPETGEGTSIIAVPAGRYEGNENGRGGYGAFKPENVWGSHTSVNSDNDHPMMILCHSDGDNYGMKNSDAWHGQHGLFLDMCQGNADFEHTSIQDYLDQYPPETNDIIYIEPGSWIGIDGGTPYFEKWLSSTYVDGECPDRWSWSVLVAAQNRVLTADDLENSYSINDVEWGIGSDTAKAWHYYLNAETSCYWYWDLDRANPWDGNVTRACNLAVTEADKVLARHPDGDARGPSIFPPQRDPYNPGGYMWDETEPASSDFEVWSFVDDVSGLSAVRLCWRTDKDGQNPLTSVQNETFAGGSEVNAWNTQDMTGSWDPAVKGPDNIVPSPSCRAQMYKATISGQNQVLIDYYVEAVDSRGNTNRSDIMHVYVGEYSGPVNYVAFDPAAPDGCNPVTIKYKKTDCLLTNANPVYIHIGRNDWQDVDSFAMSNAPGDYWTYEYATPAQTYQIVCVFSNDTGTLDNNSGADYSVAVTSCDTNQPVVRFTPSAPSGCDPVLISYQPGSGVLRDVDPIYIHVGYNEWQGVVDPDPAMTNNSGAWEYWYYPPAGTYEIDCCFNDGASVWESNNGQDYQVAVTNCENTNAAVVFSPAAPLDDQVIRVEYDAAGRSLSGVTPLYITMTFDGWSSYADYPMTNDGVDLWSYAHSIPQGTTRIYVNFRDATNGTPVIDDNSGANWAVDVSAGLPTNTLNFAGGSPALQTGGTPNNAGDNFDMSQEGGYAGNYGSGFGDFGQVFMNYDSNALYVGAYGVDVVGENNAFIIFLATDNLTYDAENLWNMSGNPYGLDVLHNMAFQPPIDMAILLGDVYGDGIFPEFQVASTFEFGQGPFFIETNTFSGVDGATLSQFDGTGTNACVGNWDDSPDRGTKRWECRIPWSNLNVSGVGELTNLYISGIFVSSSVTNNDRYLSGNYIGTSASGDIDEWGNFGFNFVTLNGLSVGAPSEDLDGDGVPDNWKDMTFGKDYHITDDSDFDSDGCIDRHEYHSGTNPKNDESYFGMSAPQPVDASQIRISWLSVPGWSYDLLCATNLSDPVFLPVQTGIPATADGVNVYTATTDRVRCFFRVETQHP
jgi:hypothetical protein